MQTEETTDHRIDHILEVVLELAAGDLNARTVPSDSDDDEIDTVIAALNLLGDQLRSSNEQMERQVAERTAQLAEANAALRKSENCYRHLWEHLNDAAFLADIDNGTLLELNRAAEELVRRSREELIGQPITLLHPPERAAEYAEQFRRHVERGGTSYDLEVVRADGTRVPVDVSATAFEIGERRAALGLFRDVTERRRAEEQLRENAEAMRRYSLHLERVNAELQQFLYVASHDLKAPLRAVSHLSSLLQEQATAGDLEQAGATAATLGARVQRMHGLIDALLGYALAGQEQRPEAVDSGDLVRSVVATLELPSDVHVQLREPMPQLTADALHLRQVFAELIGNALRHRGGAALELVVGGSDEGAEYSFFVQDNGPGIPPAYRERVFEMFQTLVNREQTEHVGMGLTLVRKLVQAAGGRVWLDDAPERGLVVRFTWMKEPA